MVNLGKIERFANLRTIWADEAQDFSKWLAEDESLVMLSNAIGIDIVHSERESSVGSFSVDIFAEEVGTGRKIIIENQLEKTDHDHLGKIVTYASGKNAEVIIWIVKNARDEHRQAIEWLNQHTDENIGFFLIEIELWKIDDSLPALNFNVVERPNDWAKTLKIKNVLTPTQKLQLEYWEAFKEYAFDKQAFSDQFELRKAQGQRYFILNVGSSSCHLSLTANMIAKTKENLLGAEIYIPDDKELYEKFNVNKQAIEDELGLALEWHVGGNKACKIMALVSGDIKDSPQNWRKYFDWYCTMAIKLKGIIKKYDV